MLIHVYQKGHDKVATRNLWRKMRWLLAARISGTENIRISESKMSDEKKQIVGMKQKNVGCIETFVERCSQRGEIIVNLFSGMLATAKTC